MIRIRAEQVVAMSKALGARRSAGDSIPGATASINLRVAAVARPGGLRLRVEQVPATQIEQRTPDAIAVVPLVAVARIVSDERSAVIGDLTPRNSSTPSAESVRKSRKVSATKRIALKPAVTPEPSERLKQGIDASAIETHATPFAATRAIGNEDQNTPDDGVSQRG